MKNKVISFFRYLIPKTYSLVLIPIFVFNCLVYWGARALTSDKPHYDVSTMMDDQFPFMPSMIIVYWGCYVFWGIVYYIIVNKSRTIAIKFAIAEMLGKFVCFVIYLAYPTTMIRPDVVPTDVFTYLTDLLYRIDAADMLFPSIHCYVSWMCYLGSRKMDELPVFVRALILAIAVLICISTLLIKQHVILDVFSGVLLAEMAYRLIHSTWGRKCKKA